MMDYNIYNIKMLEETFTLNGEELDIFYRVTMQGGIELSTYYKSENRKMHYLDTFDDYYDEYELLYDLHMEFIDYLKTI